MTASYLWLFVVGYGALGALGVFAPGGMRRLVEVFLRKASLRIFGAVLLVLGMLLARLSALTTWNGFVMAMAVCFFLAGGVQLFIPTVVIVLNDWWSDRPNPWQRAIGALYIVFAVLFGLAATSPAAL